MIHIAETWQNILAELTAAESASKIVYVIGANDSGKSTFCRFLLEHLTKNFQTAYIDCDPGQSVIGPPTTLGLEIFSQSDARPRINFLYFIGATTPRGHLLTTLAGVRKLTDRAIQSGSQRIILDSCGFVLDKPAREFQFHLIDLIHPDYLIVFDQSNEIIRWIHNFRKRPGIKIYHLPVSPSVIPRTPTDRKNYREEKFKNYFASAEPQQLILKGIGFHGRIPDLREPAACRQRLVALCNAENYVLTLGIAQEIDLANKIFRIVSPDFDPGEVVFICFGSIYLTEDGKQVFRNYAA